MKFFYWILIVCGVLILIWYSSRYKLDRVGYTRNKKEIQIRNYEYLRDKKMLESAKYDAVTYAQQARVYTIHDPEITQQPQVYTIQHPPITYRSSHSRFQSECYTDAMGQTRCYSDYTPQYESQYYPTVQTLGNPTGPVMDYKPSTVALPSMNPERWYVERPAYWNGINRMELL